MQLDINMALTKGDFNLLRDLVESGADIDIRDRKDRTALINCCLHDGEDWALGSARLLLQHGAKTHLCDKYGRNALMYAIMYRREKLVELFLGALDLDLTHTDKWKRTALWYATSSGNITITILLRNILKKYHLESESSAKYTTSKEKTAVQKVSQQRNNLSSMNCIEDSQSRFKVHRTGYFLPYKTLPACIWSKRAKLNIATKSLVKKVSTGLTVLQPATKQSSLPIIQEKSPSHHSEKINQENSQEDDWRKDLKRLHGILEMQLSSFYCTKAKPFPESIQRYPKIIQRGIQERGEDELKGNRLVNRRSSFDARSQKSVKSISMRRSSVAVICLSRFQSLKPSFSSKQEQ